MVRSWPRSASCAIPSSCPFKPNMNTKPRSASSFRTVAENRNRVLGRPKRHHCCLIATFRGICPFSDRIFTYWLTDYKNLNAVSKQSAEVWPSLNTSEWPLESTLKCFLSTCLYYHGLWNAHYGCVFEFHEVHELGQLHAAILHSQNGKETMLFHFYPLVVLECCSTEDDKYDTQINYRVCFLFLVISLVLYTLIYQCRNSYNFQL